MGGGIGDIPGAPELDPGTMVSVLAVAGGLLLLAVDAQRARRQREGRAQSMRWLTQTIDGFLGG